MPPLSLSNELLLKIVGYFKYESDINSLMQVTGRLYYLPAPYLYRFNARYHKGSALKWAFENNRASAVQKALEAAIPKAGETPKNDTGAESMEGLVVLSPGWNLQPQKSEGGDGKPNTGFGSSRGLPYTKCW